MNQHSTTIVTLGDVHPFPTARCDTDHALKVLEEAAEVFCAWRDYDRCTGTKPISTIWHQALVNQTRDSLLDKCADLIMACANMMHGVDQAPPDLMEVDYKCPITKDHMRFLLARASGVWHAECIGNNLVTADMAMMLIVETCEIIANMDVEDFRPYMEACMQRNRERERYEIKRNESFIGKEVTMRVIDEWREHDDN